MTTLTGSGRGRPSRGHLDDTELLPFGPWYEWTGRKKRIKSLLTIAESIQPTAHLTEQTAGNAGLCSPGERFH